MNEQISRDCAYVEDNYCNTKLRSAKIFMEMYGRISAWCARRGLEGLSWGGGGWLVGWWLVVVVVVRYVLMGV